MKTIPHAGEGPQKETGRGKRRLREGEWGRKKIRKESGREEERRVYTIGERRKRKEKRGESE